MERFGKNAFAHASMLSHARTHTPVLRLRRLYSLIGLESVSDSCIYPWPPDLLTSLSFLTSSLLCPALDLQIARTRQKRRLAASDVTRSVGKISSESLVCLLSQMYNVHVMQICQLQRAIVGWFENSPYLSIYPMVADWLSLAEMTGDMWESFSGRHFPLSICVIWHFLN